MSAKFLDLDRFRMISTGANYSFQLPVAPCNPISEDNLKNYALDIYIFFSEQMSVDVTFLSRFGDSSKVQYFGLLINKVRTYYGHAPTEEIRRYVSMWRQQYAAPEHAVDNLQKSLDDALGALVIAAATVSRSMDLSSEWQKIVQVEVGAIMKAVVTDMGLHFRTGKLGFMTRRVEGRLKIEPRQNPYAEFVAELCSQEVISQRSPLPVTYDKVLDYLGLLRGEGASGALLVAHSVATIAPELKGEEFLKRVEDTWRSAAKY